MFNQYTKSKFGNKGVFTCENCNRKTRQLGDYHYEDRYCPYCITANSILCSQSDDGEVSPALVSAYKKALKAIAAKGGQYTPWNPKAHQQIMDQ